MKPCVLVVDDEPSYLQLYSDTLVELDIDCICAANVEEALQLYHTKKPSMVVSDVKMPGASGIDLLKEIHSFNEDIPFLLITAHANVRDAVTSLKLGAVDYLAKPVDLTELKAAVSDALQLGDIDADFDFPDDALRDIVVEDKQMLSIYSDAYRVSHTDVTVLITGESGTGKEVISRFITDNSPRCNKPLVTVNCASIPANLLASELFGHEKGAFTGAVNKRLGRFREAHGGTLFLDEIGDMPLELQPSLLRALENNVITPVGSDKEISVDFRLVAATNKNLEEEVQKGNFREDLYYRLNVITFELPSLVERKEEVPALARFFLSKKSDKRLSSAALRAVMNYDWPGNVRELANAMERARILSRSELIMPEHLPASIQNALQNTTVEYSPDEEIVTLERQELDSIRKALEHTNGNQTKAAQLLGISRRTLINKMKKL